jgi:hypothetical protein
MAKRGKRIEATPELIEAVLSDLARGLTREWACALNGISHDSWERWEKRPEFAELRARAIGVRVKYLIGQLETEENLARAKSIQWLLERNKSYQNQFAPQGDNRFNFTQNNLPFDVPAQTSEEAAPPQSQGFEPQQETEQREIAHEWPIEQPIRTMPEDCRCWRPYR